MLDHYVPESPSQKQYCFTSMIMFGLNWGKFWIHIRMSFILYLQQLPPRY